MPPVKVALRAPAAACCVEPSNAHGGLLVPSEADRRAEVEFGCGWGSRSRGGFVLFHTMSEIIGNEAKWMEKDARLIWRSHGL